MKLRPHHGLCIRFFEGKGYSEAFVENMKNVIATLENDSIIEITKGKDEICKACPNMVNGICTDHVKVSNYDQQVLDYIYQVLGEKINDLSYKRFQDYIEEAIMQSGKFESICGDCVYAEICHK